MKPVELIRTIEIKDRTGRVIGTKDVVTYPGLLSKAHEEGLSKVETSLLQIPTDENSRTAIAKAVVHRFGVCDAGDERNWYTMRGARPVERVTDVVYAVLCDVATSIVQGSQYRAVWLCRLVQSLR